MSPYQLPRSVKQLFALAGNVLEGLRIHDGALNLPEELNPVILEQAITNARHCCQALQQETKRGPAFAQVLKEANRATKPFFPLARAVLSRHLGARWSRKWKLIGWRTRGGRSPVAARPRELLLAALWHYFTANPGHEDPSLDVTATSILRYYKPLRQARLASEAYEQNLATARRQRMRSMKHLRSLLRTIVNHLETVLDDTEDDWQPFGLIPPALQMVPDWAWPLNLRPLPVEEGPGKLHIAWSEAPRALYYEVFRRRKGIDSEFTFIDSVAGTELTLFDQPVGTPIAIRVIPVNLAGAGAWVQGEVDLPS